MTQMKPAEYWKNFSLGEELSIAGAFAYNGLRRFCVLRWLDYPDEVFEVLYNLAVGMERLLKTAIVLLEHADDLDQEKLENSLKTHNHLKLLEKVQRREKINLDAAHVAFLELLATFYKSYRYDRFSISSTDDLQKERDELLRYFAEQLNLKLPNPESLAGTPNEGRYKKFLRRIVHTICRAIYDVIRSRASDLNLYTYELRDGSKAKSMFLGQTDIPTENLLWKELLVFFMNTKARSGYLQFLRAIPPLDFDPGRVDEYLDCFQSDVAKSLVVEELESHYEEVDDNGERLQTVEVIGSPYLHFDDPDEEENLIE